MEGVPTDAGDQAARGGGWWGGGGGWGGRRGGATRAAATPRAAAAACPTAAAACAHLFLWRADQALQAHGASGKVRRGGEQRLLAWRRVTDSSNGSGGSSGGNLASPL